MFFSPATRKLDIKNNEPMWQYANVAIWKDLSYLFIDWL